ncbi:MAG: hypothetical protein COW92_01470 [Candidatus Omnitrophica bacterium CG22_combo_CG10-13_8_21_14_all_43_16]|nr:MAG: hypothetical protein COW92_01470 [Candidatus Omnitrophica bacterium CG22_combo_CG10-13_8_21_14_all_43_16]
MKLVMTDKILTAGEKITIRDLTIPARDKEILTGFFAERVLAATSKTIIRKDAMIVAQIMLLEFWPIKEIMITVTIDAMRASTILLATRMVPKNFSGVSKIFNTILALFDPSAASRLNFIILAAIIAVSDAAVKAPIKSKIISNKSSMVIFIFV